MEWIETVRKDHNLGEQVPFTFSFRVPKDAIDNLNHVNNEVYLTWMLEAATRHSAALGFGLARYRELGGYFVVRRHEINYLWPALENDEIVVATWLGHMRRSTAVRHYLIYNQTQKRPSSQGLTQWTFVDSQTGRPKEIPVELRKVFDPNHK